MRTHPWKAIHIPTDSDYREATDWQESFEECDLLRKAIWNTERSTGASIEVSNRLAFYDEPNNEMQAHIDLGVQVNAELRKPSSVAYLQIANVLRTLAEEISSGLPGEDKT